MAFEIDHAKMVSSIKCDACQAVLNIYTDDQRTIDQSMKKYQKEHKCNDGGRKEPS